MSSLEVRELGVVPYRDALETQRRMVEERLAGRIGDTLLLLEHPPVITLGRGWKSSSLPLDRGSLERRGIEVFEIERGGDVTYHGPGQLVGYPIIDLQGHRADLHWYLRQLENVVSGALAALGVTAGTRDGLTGVWVGDRKIASIGIHVKQWVTSHGFALNVTTDLSPFSLIVPCGIPDVRMTSVLLETDKGAGRWAGSVTALNEACRAVVTESFSRVFGYDDVRRALTSVDPLIRSPA